MFVPELLSIYIILPIPSANVRLGRQPTIKPRPTSVKVSNQTAALSSDHDVCEDMDNGGQLTDVQDNAFGHYYT